MCGDIGSGKTARNSYSYGQGGGRARGEQFLAASRPALSQRNHALEQQISDMRLQLGERDQDLAAARAANRELMTQLNAAGRH